MTPVIMPKAQVSQPVQSKVIIPPSKAQPSQSKPMAPLASPTTQKPKLRPPSTVSGFKTLKGGFKVKHTCTVNDRSDDRNQFFPYQVHCNTCGFESKHEEYDIALSMASSHVGA